MTTRLLSIALLFFVAGCAPRHLSTRQAAGVAFSLQAPNANEVLFASSLDQFRLHPIKKNDEGVWVTDSLVDREFRYFYVVDGGIYVPSCNYTEKDDFGKTNCIYQP